MGGICLSAINPSNKMTFGYNETVNNHSLELKKADIPHNRNCDIKARTRRDGPDETSCVIVVVCAIWVACEGWLTDKHLANILMPWACLVHWYNLHKIAISLFGPVVFTGTTSTFIVLPTTSSTSP